MVFEIVNMYFKGGRPKDPIWKHFLEVKINGKQMAKCRECEYTVVNKVARMKIHYEKHEKSTESPVEQADTDSADTHISKDIKILKVNKINA
jgi:hypothetical protein